MPKLTLFAKFSNNPYTFSMLSASLDLFVRCIGKFSYDSCRGGFGE